jgi:hypothetical protein
MNYSRTARPPEAYHWVDLYGLFLNPTGGYGDTILRTCWAYICYGDQKLLMAIFELWDLKPPILGRRHPSLSVNDKMSRDHYVYTLVAFYIGVQRGHISKTAISKIADNVPFRIWSMARMTSGLVAWSKGLAGSKSGAFIFYIIEGIMARMFYTPLTKLAFSLTGTDPEVDQQEWEVKYLQDQPQWKWWILKKIAFPAYAITFTGFQYYVMDQYPKLRKWSMKGYWPIVGETNYLQHILFETDQVSEISFSIKVSEFKPMTKMRWTGYLNKANDRPMRVMERKLFNNLDVDIIQFMFYQKLMI